MSRVSHQKIANEEITGLRKDLIGKILSKQDDLFRWGFDAKQARERPEYVYYAPNFRSTLWTLLLLADLKAPRGLAKVQAALALISAHFYSPEHGIFRLQGMSHFPIPCLNGNLLHLHHYFGSSPAEDLDRTISFFTATQRFDDGNFSTPTEYPYGANRSCYGKHTCFWG